MKVRDRIKALTKLYRDEIKDGNYEDFCAEAETILKDNRSREGKKVKTPPRINNQSRFKIIQDIQQICFEGFMNIPYEISGYVADTFIVFLRRSINGGGFEEFSKELYDICNKSGEEDKGFNK